MSTNGRYQVIRYPFGYAVSDMQHEYGAPLNIVKMFEGKTSHSRAWTLARKLNAGESTVELRVGTKPFKSEAL